MFANQKFMSVLIIAAILGLAGFAQAAALSDNRDTPELRPADKVWLTQGSNIIYAGSIVAVDSSGLAVPGADTAGYDVVGRAEVYSHNSGSTYDSTKTIVVKSGVFRWENGDTITDADIGSIVYVSDDQTVQKGASSHNIIAGIVKKVDSDGVWVDTKDIGAQGAITPATMAVAGNSTVGGTLGVTGNTTLGGTLGVTGNSTVGGTLGVTGILTALNNAIIGGTLTATGVVTHVAAPKYTVTSTPGTVEAAALANLPTGATTNAAYLKITIGTNDFAVPIYQLP